MTPSEPASPAPAADPSNESSDSGPSTSGPSSGGRSGGSSSGGSGSGSPALAHTGADIDALAPAGVVGLLAVLGGGLLLAVKRLSPIFAAPRRSTFKNGANR